MTIANPIMYKCMHYNMYKPCIWWRAQAEIYAYIAAYPLDRDQRYIRKYVIGRIIIIIMIWTNTGL